MIGIFIILSFSILFIVYRIKTRAKMERDNGWKGPISHPYVPKDEKKNEVRDVEDDLGMPESSIVPEPFPIEDAARALEKALPSDDDDIVYVIPSEELQALEYERDMEEMEKGLQAFSLTPQE